MCVCVLLAQIFFRRVLSRVEHKFHNRHYVFLTSNSTKIEFAAEPQDRASRERDHTHTRMASDQSTYKQVAQSTSVSVVPSPVDDTTASAVVSADKTNGTSHKSKKQKKKHHHHRKKTRKNSNKNEEVICFCKEI